MKRLFSILTMVLITTLGFSQVKNWQLERSDTTGTDREFVTTDPARGIREFVSRDSLVNLLFGGELFYDQTYTSIADGDTISNQFPNEIEVNIVRAINNDSIVITLDTMSYDYAPEYVLGLTNTTVTDSFITGTLKLVPKDSVSTLDFAQNLDADLYKQNIKALAEVENSARLALIFAFIALALSLMANFAIFFKNNK